MTRELEVAIAAARAAGEVVLSAFSQQQEIQYKGEVDLVTEADERAERAIIGVLQEAFPSYGILTEESGELEGEAEARWIVDPLDGTTNYVHSVPFFSTSIALQRGSEVVLGVVHDPMNEETYAAACGEGATLNGQIIWVSDTDELIKAVLTTGFSAEHEDISADLDLFGKFIRRTRGVRQLGSAALEACYVAAGRLDGYYRRGLSAWDVAAGSLIVEVAGGKVTDYQGGKLNLQDAEIVASNGFLHPSLVHGTSSDGS